MSENLPWKLPLSDCFELLSTWGHIYEALTTSQPRKSFVRQPVNNGAKQYSCEGFVNMALVRCAWKWKNPFGILKSKPGSTIQINRWDAKIDNYCFRIWTLQLSHSVFIYLLRQLAHSTNVRQHWLLETPNFHLHILQCHSFRSILSCEELPFFDVFIPAPFPQWRIKWMDKTYFSFMAKCIKVSFV
jgi:hypothetical protein